GSSIQERSIRGGSSAVAPEPQQVPPFSDRAHRSRQPRAISGMRSASQKLTLKFTLQGSRIDEDEHGRGRNVVRLTRRQSSITKHKLAHSPYVRQHRFVMILIGDNDTPSHLASMENTL